jgi:hypothetical protein
VTVTAFSPSILRVRVRQTSPIGHIFNQKREVVLLYKKVSYTVQNPLNSDSLIPYMNVCTKMQMKIMMKTNLYSDKWIVSRMFMELS